jgi:beta-phosphoglucomutase
MKYKAVIFDMDGTIVDTEKLWTEANKILLERRGIYYSGELKDTISQKVRGLATHKSCGIIKEVACLTDHIDDLVKEKSEIAHSLYQHGISFIDGFEFFHGSVIQHNLKTGIATNADAATLNRTITALQLERFFGVHMYGISEVGYECKPHPAIYLYTASKLGVDPKECIAIEDSAYGVAAAQGAGMYCIGITTSSSYGEVKNSDYIVKSYHEIDLKKLL